MNVLRRASSLAIVALLFASCSGEDPGGAATPVDLGEPGSVPDAGELPLAPVDAGEDGAPEELEEKVPAVRFIGRFDRSGPEGPLCAWPGCRVVARFEGTSVSARLDEQSLDWMEGDPSEWDVSIDGAIVDKLVLRPGPHDYLLAEDLAPGVHVVELYKRSEAQNGVTRFLSFDLHGGALLPPPNRAKRRIEIIGDSLPAGFGIEGGDCRPPMHAARYQDFHKSFGARLGEIFAAEVHGTVYSGKGIAKNIWRPDVETMPVLYDRANPLVKSSTFDLGSFVPDVIVVSIGGLDFAVGKPWDDGPTPIDEFSAKYDAFVVRLLRAYPLAHVWLMVSPSQTDEVPQGRNIRTNVTRGVTEVVRRRTAAGDARVHLAVPKKATAAELTGCEGHGNPAMHERVAQELAAMIRPLTGW